jgi:adenosylhomocysteine nucleosidase
MTRTAIIAAMPGELKPLTRGWQHWRLNGVDLWRWHYLAEKGDHGEWIAACAGAGIEAATRAFAEVEKLGPVDQVISTGWAGALREELAPGQACRVSGVIDARTGDLFDAAGPKNKCWLVTSATVADHAEKQRLASTSPASLVDMEAAAIAQLSATRAIPFFCVKGISDGYTDQLPDFNRFISADGRFQLARFIVFALQHPTYWPALIRMGENSKKAARAIAAYLLDLLDAQGQIRKRNDYPNYGH